MTRREFTMGASALPLAAPVRAQVQGKRPNFLFILCDQLSLDAIQAHGCRWVQTPNIDRLISRGVSFMGSHSTNSVCSPARSSLLTGRMPVETGVIHNDLAIRPGMPNIGEWLSGRGYQTVYSGKWHLPEGWAPDNTPGFDVLPVGGPGQGSQMDPLVAMACAAWLRSRSKDKPFFLFASLLQPHDICYWCIHPEQLVTARTPVHLDPSRLPELPPNHRSRPKAPAILDKLAYRRFNSDEEWRYYLYAYYRMVEMLDLDVGRMLEALESSGELDNTVVVFTSDHGEGGGRHQHVQKWYPYDEAVKVPLVFSCPGRIREGHRDTNHLVSTVDLVPTICDYAGIPAPPNARGISLKPFLESKDAPGHEFVASEMRISGRMIRTARYKYVRFEGDPVEQFFDMQADPWEMHNRIDDGSFDAEIGAHRKLLEAFTASMDAAPQPRA